MHQDILDRYATIPDHWLADGGFTKLQAIDWGRALYPWRAATVECANAQLRRRGLSRFNVCGLVKARAVLLWHALAHNLMRMRSLNIAVSA